MLPCLCSLNQMEAYEALDAWNPVHRSSSDSRVAQWVAAYKTLREFAPPGVLAHAELRAPLEGLVPADHHPKNLSQAIVIRVTSMLAPPEVTATFALSNNPSEQPAPTARPC